MIMVVVMMTGCSSVVVVEASSSSVRILKCIPAEADVFDVCQAHRPNGHGSLLATMKISSGDDSGGGEDDYSTNMHYYKTAAEQVERSIRSLLDFADSMGVDGTCHDLLADLLCHGSMLMCDESQDRQGYYSVAPSSKPGDCTRALSYCLTTSGLSAPVLQLASTGYGGDITLNELIDNWCMPLEAEAAQASTYISIGDAAVECVYAPDTPSFDNDCAAVSSYDTPAPLTPKPAFDYDYDGPYGGCDVDDCDVVMFVDRSPGPTLNEIDLDIYISSNEYAIAGYQFQVDGATVVNAAGGLTESSGLIINTGKEEVLAISIDHSAILPTGGQKELLVTLRVRYNDSPGHMMTSEEAMGSVTIAILDPIFTDAESFEKLDVCQDCSEGRGGDPSSQYPIDSGFATVNIVYHIMDSFTDVLRENVNDYPECEVVIAGLNELACRLEYPECVISDDHLSDGISFGHKFVDCQTIFDPTSKHGSLNACIDAVPALDAKNFAFIHLLGYTLDALEPLFCGTFRVDDDDDDEKEQVQEEQQSVAASSEGGQSTSGSSEKSSSGGGIIVLYVFLGIAAVMVFAGAGYYAHTTGMIRQWFGSTRRSSFNYSDEMLDPPMQFNAAEMM